MWTSRILPRSCSWTTGSIVLAGDVSTPLSYPENGNDSCFAVEDESFWFQHLNVVLRHLLRQFSPEGVFLDVCGGNGCVTKALQDAGVNAVLLEPGPGGALNGRNRGCLQVINSVLETAGIRPGSMSAAGAFDVVEHIEDDAGFLRELHQVLEPGGHLYLTVPAFGWLWSAEDVHAGHYRRYTVGSISRLLRGCGFDVCFTSYLFAFLVPPILAMRTLPSLLGLRRVRTQGAATKELQGTHGRGVGSLIVDWLRQRELRRIQQGGSVRLGSSVLVVARKSTAAWSGS